MIGTTATGSRPAAPVLSMFDPVHVGIDEFGPPLWIRLIYRNLLAAGEPGGGKSALMNILTAHAALSDRSRLVLFDGKQVELGMWDEVADEFVGPDIDHAITTLRRLQRVMDNRYSWLKANRRRKIEPGDGVTVITSVFDEIALFSTVLGTKAQQEEFITLLRDLVARGRAAAMPVVAATQRPSVDIIPKSLRDLFGYRAAFRCTTYWLAEIVKPNLAPLTYAKYETFVRAHIIPYLGAKRLDRIQVKDIRQWLNKLAVVCQCCAQQKDMKRPENRRCCCAVGKCCGQVLSLRSRRDARDVLRAALSCAVEDETISRNPVAAVKMTNRRASRPRRKSQAWTVEDARWFLESAWHASEALYAAFVLVLVLGLRKGEVLGLDWEQVDLDGAELYIGEQLQRVGGTLIRREVKTEASEAPLPLPPVCVTALHLRKRQQDADRKAAGDGWIETGLVFTTRHGTPIEPRNFNRSFDRCIRAARVRRITVHGTRKTCASLLAALDVHPRVAMRILRHSKIAVTMEVYTEVPSEATRDALHRLGDMLA